MSQKLLDAVNAARGIVKTCPDCGEELQPGDKTSCRTQTPLDSSDSFSVKLTYSEIEQLVSAARCFSDFDAVRQRLEKLLVVR